MIQHTSRVWFIHSSVGLFCFLLSFPCRLWAYIFGEHTDSFAAAYIVSAATTINDNVMGFWAASKPSDDFDAPCRSRFASPSCFPCRERQSSTIASDIDARPDMGLCLNNSTDRRTITPPAKMPAASATAQVMDPVATQRRSRRR